MIGPLTREAALDIVNALRRGAMPSQGLHHAMTDQVASEFGSKAPAVARPSSSTHRDRPAPG